MLHLNKEILRNKLLGLYFWLDFLYEEKTVFLSNSFNTTIPTTKALQLMLRVSLHNAQLSRYFQVGSLRTEFSLKNSSKKLPELHLFIIITIIIIPQFQSNKNSLLLFFSIKIAILNNAIQADISMASLKIELEENGKISFCLSQNKEHWGADRKP